MARIVLLSASHAIIRRVSVTVARSDRFPVATVVKAYPANSEPEDTLDGPPGAKSVEEHTVGSDGKLAAFTTLTADTPYVLAAEVGGAWRYLAVSDSTFTAPGTLRERIEARQAAAGV